MSKFTPGPWHVDLAGDIMTGDDWFVARAFATGQNPNCYQQKPNANLIAAAPEMYEALKALLPDLEWGTCGKYKGDGSAKLRALLAKADGGQ